MVEMIFIYGKPIVTPPANLRVMCAPLSSGVDDDGGQICPKAVVTQPAAENERCKKCNNRVIIRPRKMLYSIWQPLSGMHKKDGKKVRRARILNLRVCRQKEKDKKRARKHLPSRGSKVQPHAGLHSNQH